MTKELATILCATEDCFADRPDVLARPDTVRMPCELCGTTLILSRATLDRIPEDVEPFPMCERCWSHALPKMRGGAYQELNDEQLEKLREVMGDDAMPQVFALQEQIKRLVQENAGTDRPGDN